jgi:hypothetical protein
VINDDGCSIDPVITEAWFDMPATSDQTRSYRTASRYSTNAFMRLMLGDALHDRKTSPHVFDSVAERGP